MSLSHRDSNSPEHRSWMHMRERCSNPTCADWPRYGGRGITVCQRWDSYETFLSDMGRRPSLLHTLDRRNGDGNYEPDNCRWATRLEQNNNRRNVKKISAFGETHSIAQWALRQGMSYMQLYKRLRSGWPPEKALTTTSTREKATK